MKKLFSIGLVIMMVLLAGCGAKSNDKKKIVIGISPDYPPYETLNNKGEMEGFDIDMTKELFKILNKQGENLEYEFSKMSFDTIISAVNSGSVDLGISSFTYEKDRKVLYSSNYYLKTAQVVLVKANSTITSSDQLSGKTVGVQLGSTGEVAAKNIKGATIKTGEDVKVMAEELKAGSIQALVVDSGVAKNYEKTGEYKALSKPLAEEENKIIAKEGNTELMNKIDKALKEFISSKEYTTLREKWGL